MLLKLLSDKTAVTEKKIILNHTQYRLLLTIFRLYWGSCEIVY